MPRTTPTIIIISASPSVQCITFSATPSMHSSYVEEEDFECIKSGLIILSPTLQICTYALGRGGESFHCAGSQRGRRLCTVSLTDQAVHASCQTKPQFGHLRTMGSRDLGPIRTHSALHEVVPLNLIFFEKSCCQAKQCNIPPPRDLGTEFSNPLAALWVHRIQRSRG